MDGWLTIANEFTSVRVRKVHTRNGERLEIESLNLGFSIRLDALELESLSWQEPNSLSRLLESPYGPEPDTDGRALSELLPRRE
jgi:hypothetical protein